MNILGINIDENDNYRIDWPAGCEENPEYKHYNLSGALSKIYSLVRIAEKIKNCDSNNNAPHKEYVRALNMYRFIYGNELDKLFLIDMLKTRHQKLSSYIKEYKSAIYDESICELSEEELDSLADKNCKENEDISTSYDILNLHKDIENIENNIQAIRDFQ